MEAKWNENKKKKNQNAKKAGVLVLTDHQPLNCDIWTCIYRTQTYIYIIYWEPCMHLSWALDRSDRWLVVLVLCICRWLFANLFYCHAATRLSHTIPVCVYFSFSFYSFRWNSTRAFQLQRRNEKTKKEKIKHKNKKTNEEQQKKNACERLNKNKIARI